MKINIGGLPSWIVLLITGVLMKIGISAGVIPLGLVGLSNLLTFGPVVLGGVYYALDLANKIG